jgi:hypothetical protein
MPRPWMIFAWVLSMGLANALIQEHLSWPQRIVLGLASALMLWRLVHKFRMARKSWRAARDEAGSPE